MKVRNALLPGVKIIEPTIFEDPRGFFMESYNQDALLKHGIDIAFIQDNHSLSAAEGTLRGLHYQLALKAQTKLFRVTAGAVFDVVVDLRAGSPTYGQWESFVLSAENKLQLLVPKGFAHGFCTLRPHTEVQYKVDCYYSTEHDRGISWNDPFLDIAWPASEPVLSEKDKHHPSFHDADHDFIYGEAGQ